MRPFESPLSLAELRARVPDSNSATDHLFTRSIEFSLLIKACLNQRAHNRTSFDTERYHGEIGRNHTVIPAFACDHVVAEKHIVDVFSS